MTTKRRKAVLYCRVSSEGQVQHGHGLEGQESACRLYAKHNHLEIIEMFQDGGASGGLQQREGISRLFEFIDHYNKVHDDKIEVFLCEEIDRIARDISIHLHFKLEMEKRGLHMVTVKMNFEDTAVGKYNEGIMALTAQFYRDQNTERVVSRQQARLRDGFWVWQAPTGYAFEESPAGGKILTRQEPQASILATGMEKFANDELERLVDVARYWEKKGLLDYIKPSQGRKHQRISLSTVSSLLKNILFSGYITKHLITKCKKTGKVLRERNIPLTKAKHEGIISLDTYEKIQNKLNGKNQPSKHGVSLMHPDFPLRGFLQCEASGLLMTGGYSKGRSARYPYYRFNHISERKGKSIRAEKIHDQFEQMLLEMQPKEEVVRAVGVALVAYLRKEEREAEQLQVQAQEAVKKLEREQNMLVDYLYKVTDTTAIQKIEKKLSDTREKIMRLKEKLSMETPSFDMKKFEKGLRLFANPLNLRKSSPVHVKKKLLKKWFKSPISVQRAFPHLLNRPESSLYHMFRSLGSRKSKDLEIIPIILNQTGLTAHELVAEMISYHLLTKEEAYHNIPTSGRGSKKYIRGSKKSSR